MRVCNAPVNVMPPPPHTHTPRARVGQMWGFVGGLHSIVPRGGGDFEPVCQQFCPQGRGYMYTIVGDWSQNYAPGGGDFVVSLQD